MPVVRKIQATKHLVRNFFDSQSMGLAMLNFSSHVAYSCYRNKIAALPNSQKQSFYWSYRRVAKIAASFFWIISVHMENLGGNLVTKPVFFLGNLYMCLHVLQLSFVPLGNKHWDTSFAHTTLDNLLRQSILLPAFCLFSLH